MQHGCCRRFGCRCCWDDNDDVVVGDAARVAVVVLAAAVVVDVGCWWWPLPVGDSVDIGAGVVDAVAVAGLEMLQSVVVVVVAAAAAAGDGEGGDAIVAPHFLFAK